MPERGRIHFLFLNIGHFFDHYFVLIFATVAALTLTREWHLSYAELIPYATPGFIAFGVGAIPAGWLADKWSRQGMMVIFFFGIGASAILSALAQTPVQISLGLFAIGVFAAIYHPVGIAMVVQGREKTGVPLAINGIFGNLGVASAAFITGLLLDLSHWRWAFIVPGIISLITGVAYLLFLRAKHGADKDKNRAAVSSNKKPAPENPAIGRHILRRTFAIILFSTAVGGLIFQSTTFALPKVFDERLGDIAATATLVGWYAFVVFAIAAFAQLLVGYLVDRYSLRTVFAAVAALQALFFTLMQQLTGIGALLVAIAFMLVVFGQIPINDVLIGRITRSEWRSRIYAVRYIVTFSVMASSVPLIAWVHAYRGFATLFALLAVAALCILGAVLMLPRSSVIIRAGSQTSA